MDYIYIPQVGNPSIRIDQVEHGGAFYAKESKIELVECLFENNKAGLGGAIYILDSTEMTVINSSFI